MSIEIKEQGDANFYSIIKDGNWLMQIQHNGEQSIEQQKENLKIIKEALESKESKNEWYKKLLKKLEFIYQHDKDQELLRCYIEEIKTKIK